MNPIAVTSLHVERESPFIELSVVLERRFRLDGVRVMPDAKGWLVLLPGEDEGHHAFFRPLGAHALGALKEEILEAYRKLSSGAPRNMAAAA